MSAGNYDLRDYQHRSVSMIQDEFNAGKRSVLLYLPTGSGKTVIGGSICREVASTGKMVLFLVNKIELSKQAVTHMRRIGLTVAIMQADNTDLIEYPDVCVATIQTINARGWPPMFGKFRDVGVVIVDETHQFHKAHVKLIGRLSSARVIGLTATPLRADLANHYQTMVSPTTVRKLTDQGFLTPIRVFQPPDADMERLLAEVQIDYAQNDFASVELGKAMSHKKIIGDIFSHWQKFAHDRQTLIFGCNVAHAEVICDEFVGEGIDATIVTYRTDRDDRCEIIERYRAGTLQVLVSCNALSEGFDVPDVGCLILARPTLSETLCYQQLGRGSRPAPGKADCIVLDHADNVMRFGHPIDFEPPSLGASEVSASKKTLKQHKARVCPNCEAVMPPSIPTCPECGHDLPSRKPRVDVIDGRLIEIGQAAKPAAPGIAELRREFAMLRAEAMRRGHSHKAAAVQFRKRHGRFPPRSWNSDQMIPPTPEIRGWVQSHLIAYWRTQQSRS